MTLVLTQLISNREPFIQINENNCGDFESEGASEVGCLYASHSTQAVK